MNLPELPKPLVAYYDDIDKEEVNCYSAGQLQAYAEEAVRMEREACAKLVDDMCAWTGGHGEPGTPGPDKIVKAIRSRTAVPAKEIENGL